MKNVAKSLSLLALVLGLVLIPSGISNADPKQITPISWIISTQHNGDVDGKHVTLIGHVRKMDQGSDWWFSDATGSVRLDTDDKELPVGPLLKVSGNIDQIKMGVGYLEVEVTHWQYADKSQSAKGK